MKIAVLDDYQDAFRSLDCYSRLRDHEVTVFRDSEADPDRLAARLKDAEVVVLTQQRSAFPRAVIEKLPRLRLIAQTGRHTGHIDVAACTENGVIIAAAGASPPHSTAELAWGLILASTRHIPQEVHQLKQGVWQTTLGTGLHGKTLGIYGFGRIGSLVAGVGRAFGMHVVCWGREGSQSRARAAGYTVPGSRKAFFEGSDVVSLHIALNEETRGMVTAADLAAMKPSALIVNTSRAHLIAEGALVEALKKGRPGHAAVDVYEHEPVLGGNHPLLQMPNALCTPHLGYVERGNYEGYFSAVIDSILGFASGKPVNVLNPQAQPGARGRRP